jgi:hypothetical protein
MAARLSALCAARPLTSERFLILISVTDLRAKVQLERLGQLKNPVTSSGVETATFRLVLAVVMVKMAMKIHHVGPIC